MHRARHSTGQLQLGALPYCALVLQQVRPRQRDLECLGAADLAGDQVSSLLHCGDLLCTCATASGMHECDRHSCKLHMLPEGTGSHAQCVLATLLKFVALNSTQQANASPSSSSCRSNFSSNAIMISTCSDQGRRVVHMHAPGVLCHRAAALLRCCNAGHVAPCPASRRPCQQTSPLG